VPTRRERCNHAHRGRLRIVDHNRRAALGLQQRVTRLGYAVVATAASGREALVVGAALRPDVVMMEIRLPGPVDGLQEGTQIWVRFGIPVIYVTAELAVCTFQRLWPACRAGFLGKDGQGRDLQKALEEVLRLRAPTSLDAARRHPGPPAPSRPPQRPSGLRPSPAVHRSR
jgi:DNA-binding NarL/FixJ family response regulator